jgi:glycosyltransferase involved in cell wall biosynthesis
MGVNLKVENLRVATIIPFWNGSKYLRRAIESAVTQAGNFEVIVIDDGSVTKESAMAERLCGELGAKYFKIENVGQGGARNFGVAKSEAEIICFLDQDDFFLPNHHRILLKALLKAPGSAYAYGDLWRVTPEGHLLQTSCIFDYSPQPKKSLNDHLQADMHILPSASAVRKLWFQKIGGFDPQFRGFEDDDFFLRLFMAGGLGVLSPSPVTAWTLDPTSTSFSEHYLVSRMKFIRKYSNLFPNEIDHNIRTSQVLFQRFFIAVVSEVLRAKYYNSEFTEQAISRLWEIWRAFGKQALEYSLIKRRWVFILPLIQIAPPRLVRLLVRRFIPFVPGRAIRDKLYLLRDEQN